MERSSKSVLLLTNYALDRQESMLRFGVLLQQQLKLRGFAVGTISPTESVLTRVVRRTSTRKAMKWLGYVDKYILFPIQLSRRVGALERVRGSLIHVVDHSNAVYIPTRSAFPWLITCHDLLAVRGARGEDTDCPASALGRKLQDAIVRGLSLASAISCDSTSTLEDVDRLIPRGPAQLRRVIHLGLNHPYRQIEGAEARARLQAITSAPWSGPFVVHVGSNLARKNKLGVLRVFEKISARWPGNLVFCGAPLSPELRGQIASRGLAGRVFSVPHPSNAELEAIYSVAHALLYPSTCEGFGWPIIEAQACGCPVVCSDRTSLPEIGGAAAIVHKLEDENGMAESLLRLAEPEFRIRTIRLGLANLERFATVRMVDAYAALYEEVLAQ